MSAPQTARETVPRADGSEALQLATVDSPPQVARGMPVFTLLDEDKIQALPDPDWLVEGLLPSQSISVMYGPSGVGKTFVALDLALSVSAGIPFLGRAVKAGPVVYVMAEGHRGLKRRLAAWKRGRQVVRVPRFRCLPEAVDLRQPDQVQALIESIRAWCSPALIVIDTLARCYGDGDENHARDMQGFVEAVEALGRRTRTAVLIVHHTGKQGLDERGSSALRGAVDTMISLAGNDVLCLTCAKQKDGAPFKPVDLVLQGCLDSCVVEAQGARPADELDWKALKCLEVLREGPAEGFRHGEWATQCAQRGVSSGSFDRARKTLVGSNLVHRDASRRYSVMAEGGARTPGD